MSLVVFSTRQRCFPVPVPGPDRLGLGGRVGHRATAWTCGRGDLGALLGGTGLGDAAAEAWWKQ